MTTNSKRLLLTSLTIASIVAFAFVFRLSDNRDEKAVSKHASLSKGPMETAATSVTSNTTIVAPTKSLLRAGIQKFFLANRQSGVIGLWGGNQVDNPVDNIFTVEVNEPLTENDAVWLTYRLRGVKDFSNIACSVNDRLAFGGYQVKTTDSSSVQRIQLSPEWLIAGTNRIHFGLPENANFGYKVSELSIEVLKDGYGSPLIAQASPSSYKGMVYVHGSVTRCKSARVTINGSSVKVIDNEFEALVPASVNQVSVLADLDGKPFSSQIAVGKDVLPDTVFAFDRSFERQQKLFIKGKSNQLQVKNAELIVDQTSLKVTQKLSLTSLRGVDVPAMDLGLTNVTDVNSGFRFLPHGEHFNKPATVAIKYDRTKIPDGYTENDIRTFYFDSNSKHWVALERDTVNKDLCMVVSKTTHFTDMINGVIKAPESPETQGYTPTMMNDIKVADPTSGIQLIAPPSANNMGSANLTYNLELPPARAGISPNLAIQYNSDGGSGWLGEGWDLNVPSITVDTRWGVPRYDSKYETETYSMGGVTLATVLDTLQSEDLGSAIVAHKGVLYERLVGMTEEGVQFHPVVEGNFSRITRIGKTPGNYYWKMVTKDGLTYTYGGGSQYKATLQGSVKSFDYKNLTDSKKDRVTKTAIAEWRLSSVEDQYRNFCRYYYDDVTYQIPNSIVNAKNTQLRKIEIGRSRIDNNGIDTIYQVLEFVQKTSRSKLTTNAKYGFLTTNSPYLLDSVRLHAYEPNGTLSSVRGYRFYYNMGVFDTQLLEKVSQLDSHNSEVGAHVFSYNKKPSNHFFKTEETISTTSVENSSSSWKASTKGLPALGGSKSKSISGSIHAGVGAGIKLGPVDIGGDIGYNYSYSSTTSDTKMTMVDINGDGLPDKLYKGTFDGADGLYFIPNMGNGQFGTHGIHICGYGGNFSFTKTTSHTNGWNGTVSAGIKKAKVSVDAGMDWLTSSSETTSYFSDVNNDGLIDIVSNKVVYFNYIDTIENDVAIPSFSTNSGVTPRPVMNIKSVRGKANTLKLSDLFMQKPSPSLNDTLSTVIDTSEIPIQRDSAIVMEEKIVDYNQIPMQDMVRFWEAPRSGNIKIFTQIKYLGNNAIEGVDGVRLAIQKNGVEIWVDSIKPNDANLERSTSYMTDISAGQRIYFRVQSGANNFSDGLEDVVKWSQQILYYDFPDVSFADPDGYIGGAYQSTQAAFVSQQFDNVIDSVSAEDPGIYLQGVFSKPETRDPITLKLFLDIDSLLSKDSIAYVIDTTSNGYDTTKVTYKVWYPNEYYYEYYDLFVNKLVWQKTYGTEAIPLNSLNMYTEKMGYSWFGCPLHFRFEITSSTNLKWEEVIWRPEIRYKHPQTNRDTICYAGVKYNIFEQKYLSGDGTYERFYTTDNGKEVNLQLNTTQKYANNTRYILLMYDIVNNQQVARVEGFITSQNTNQSFTLSGLSNHFYHYDLYVDDTISRNEISASCIIQRYGVNTEFIPNIYSRQSESRNIFGHLWRGWGQFQYNAGNGRYAKPIEEDSLFLPQGTTQQEIAGNMSLDKIKFYLMSHKPYKENYYWTGTNDYLFMMGDTMCTGRLNYGEMPSVLSPDTIVDDSSYVPEQPSPIIISSPIYTGGTNLTGALYEIRNAPIISNRSKSETTWGGASASIGSYSGGIGGSKSSGENTVTSGFMDLNGDGFPDYITDNRIEFTNQNGGRDGEIINIQQECSTNDSKSIGFNNGSSASRSVSNARNSGDISSSLSKSMDVKKSTTGSNIPELGASNFISSPNCSKSTNNTYSTTSYTDINGDGLPDRLFIRSNRMYVCLNLGYGFSDSIDWGVNKISHMRSLSAAVAVSGPSFEKELYNAMGGQKGTGQVLKWLKKLNLGVSFGMNGVYTTNYCLASLFDLNMDGLPDKIFKDESTKKIAVQFNKGNSFMEAITLDEIEEFNKSFSNAFGANLSVSININIWILKLSIGGSGSLGWTTDYNLNQMLDIDGDGFPDVVKASEKSDQLAILKVKRSLIGCTNKLYTITNPMGGRLRLAYEHTQPSYNHPGGKWVMSEVSVNDGIIDDGDSIINKFTYTLGKYDRYEREFLGFGSLVTENILSGNSSFPTYRKTIQKYDNSNYYTRGSLLSSETVRFEDNLGKTYSETTNNYRAYIVTRVARSYPTDTALVGKYFMTSIDPQTILTKNNMFLHQYIVYNPLSYNREKLNANSGSPQASLITKENYWDYNTEPGTHGEISLFKYSDKGNLGESGTGAYNYKTTISYLRNKPLMTLFALPTSVSVTNGLGKEYRKTLAVWNDNFANQLRIVKNVIGSGDTIITNLGYDAWGNLSQEILPNKDSTKRMWYTYKYDNFYHLYPTEVSDRFGYKSFMGDYEYRFGIPCRTTDYNGNVMLTSLDNLGRVSTITGPNEVANGKPYTLKFEYFPQATVSSGKIDKHAYAVTKHYDESHPNDDLETVTFCDGFGRSIQVNKDAFVNGSAASIISGRVKYDAFGRPVKTYYPTIETNLGNKYTFHAAFEDSVPPTETTYDELDRVTSVKQPDGNETATSYSIDGGYLKTLVTDAMGGTQATFTNGSGLTMRTEQYSGPAGTITTTFEYDAINQPTAVIDTKGERTESFYDLAGRRTKLIHPASGTTLLGYDLAGNMTSRKTANLALLNDSITYTYEYNRLKSIHYPQHSENDVYYTYGDTSEIGEANGNRAGRLKYLVDGSGAQEFTYGRMGEITQTRRSLVIPNQAVATYVTDWTYDSWNRVRSMTYPDGETLTYSYDLGGQLAGLTGSKGGFSYPYVKSITYDRFEQRNYIKYGNDAETRYTYNDSTRNLMGLSVLSTKLDPDRTLMNNAYTYDKVSNVLSVTNSAPIPGSGIGGQMTHHYQYDGLYRLASANGTYTGAGLAPNQKKAEYQLTMAYDNLHNITGKKQTLEQQNLQFAGVLKSGYDLTYAYNPGKPQQINTIADTSYRTDGTIVKSGKSQSYSYDANGNMLCVNTTQPAPDGTPRLANNRRLLWDEENRLLAVSDNGFVSNYWYDASGERTVKMSGQGEGVLVNGRLSGGRTGTSNYTAYVNPYLVITNGGQMSKHFYIGSQRIVSQLCSSGSMVDATKNPQTTAKAAASKVDYTTKYAELTSKVKTRFDSLGVAYHGTNNAGAGFWTYTPTVNETDQYYYHPDHLGSSSLITNLAGDLVQHIEYVPFGEVFVEERTSTWGTPYKFTGKELDEETGLYYFVHRYLDPRTGLWLSVDPLAEKYPGYTAYQYCRNNPTRLIDPTGMGDEESSGVASKLNNSTGYNTAAQSSITTNSPIQRLNSETLIPPVKVAEFRDANREKLIAKHQEIMSDPIAMSCLTNPVLKATAVGGLAITALAIAPEMVNIGSTTSKVIANKALTITANFKNMVMANPELTQIVAGVPAGYIVSKLTGDMQDLPQATTGFPLFDLTSTVTQNAMTTIDFFKQFSHDNTTNTQQDGKKKN